MRHNWQRWESRLSLSLLEQCLGNLLYCKSMAVYKRVGSISANPKMFVSLKRRPGESGCDGEPCVKLHTHGCGSFITATSWTCAESRRSSRTCALLVFRSRRLTTPDKCRQYSCYSECYCRLLVRLAAIGTTGTRVRVESSKTRV